MYICRMTWMSSISSFRSSTLQILPFLNVINTTNDHHEFNAWKSVKDRTSLFNMDSTILIELDNPQGSTIKGRLKVHIAESTEVQSISINFEGNGSVSWTDDKNRLHEAKENYLKKRILLVDGVTENITLEKGDFTYPFESTLPRHLPSSYTSDIGNIQYLIIAKFKGTSLSNSHKIISRLPFLLNRGLNPTLPVLTISSSRQSAQLSSGFFCCRNGPVGYDIQVQRHGSAPGDFVKFSGEFVNRSRKEIPHVKLTLLQVVDFYAQESSKTVIREISSVYSKPIEKGTEFTWSGKEAQMRIPEVPPSGLPNCDIIDVQYQLLFEMDGVNLKASFPINIGTNGQRQSGHRSSGMA